jgi:hypothetical protein
LYTEQFNKKVTFSHDYNEVTGEPTITSYISIVMKVSEFVWNQYDKMFCTFTNREDSAAKIKTLKEKVCCVLQFVKTNPTRPEVLTAVILKFKSFWTCAILLGK